VWQIGAKDAAGLAQGSRETGPTCGLALAPAQEDPALKLALEGNCTEHHRYLLGRLLGHLGYLERQTREFGQRIRHRLDELVLAQRWSGWTASLALTGSRLECARRDWRRHDGLPDEHHLASWCGMCPGNEESAGDGCGAGCAKAIVGCGGLVEAAWAASRVKKSYLRAQFRRLAPGVAKKRALVAVAHSLLVIIYHVLKYNVEYRDLGPDYFDRLEPERFAALSGQRLQSLGYDVTLSPRNPDDRAA